jgi:hypothetical protein
MHKSEGEERVCGNCGGILLTPAEHRKLVRARAQQSLAGQAGVGNGARPGSGPTVKTVTRKLETKGANPELAAIREALDFLQSTDDRRAMPDRRAPADRRDTDRRDTQGGPSQGRRPSRGWLIAIGVTVVVAIVAGLVLGTGGGSNAGAGGGTASSATATTISLFQFTGSGPSTTGPFTTTSAFTFSYTMTCQEVLADPAVFQLLRAGHDIGEVSSDVGTHTLTGSQSAFGTAGTFTVAVDAPTSCTWTVSGDT